MYKSSLMNGDMVKSQENIYLQQNESTHLSLYNINIIISNRPPAD